MLIILKSGLDAADVDRTVAAIGALGYECVPIPDGDRVAVKVTGPVELPAIEAFRSLAGVEAVLPMTRPLTRVARSARPERTVVRVGRLAIGGGPFTIVAGPCAVESEDQLLRVATAVRQSGADMLRGGAYKPRTSPYEFQGLGRDGLRFLARAREATGLPVVTEAVDEPSLELVEEYADVVQVGARNMQNFQLLKRVGRSPRPVLLKRAPSATLEELLAAAEYVLEAGNPHVILCERGIRTFSGHSRFTLDLSIVPLLERLTHLPVFVDPSHASGRRESVAPLARAALAAGADGVMVEVHPDPRAALCDGAQSLPPVEFAALSATLRALEPLVARQRESIS